MSNKSSNELEYTSDWVVGFIKIRSINTDDPVGKKKAAKLAPVLFESQKWFTKWQTFIYIIYGYELGYEIRRTIGARKKVEIRITDLPLVWYTDFIANSYEFDSRFYHPENKGHKRFALRLIRVGKKWRTIQCGHSIPWWY